MIPIKIKKEFDLKSKKRLVEEEFNKVAEIYDKKNIKYFLYKRLEFIDKYLPNNKLVLDAGTGTGIIPRNLNNKGNNFVGIDISEKMLDQAKKMVDKKTKLIRADLELIPFKDNSIDVITCSEVIEHSPNPKKILKEFYRVLKPNGILVLTTWNKIWAPIDILRKILKIGAISKDFYSYSYWSLKKDLINIGFKDIKYQGIIFFPFGPKFLNKYLEDIPFLNKFTMSLGFKCNK